MTSTIILLISMAILLSYIVEIFSTKLKIPSVLLLLVIGVMARAITQGTGITEDSTMKIIPILGTIGLVLIVFEGGMELEIDRKKKQLIVKSLFVALGNFIVVTLVLSVGMQFLSESSFRVALINSIPIGVVSSAIAIPAAKFLNKQNKEFITYESVFSDILGVLALGYALEYETFSLGLIVEISIQIVLIIVICVLFCAGMIWLMKTTSHHLKYLLTLNNLLLIYTVGKLFHLPVLILALVFGIVVKNFHLFRFGKWDKYVKYSNFSSDVHELEGITKEGVFLVKTFFFLLLGYMIDLTKLLSFINIGMVCIMLTLIFVVRWVILRFTIGKEIRDLLFVSPRGLISVLLFLSIPASFAIPAVNLEVLLLLILVNSMIIPVVFSLPEKRTIVGT